MALDLVIVVLGVEGLSAHLCIQSSDLCDVSQLSGSSNTFSEARLF